MPRRDLCLIASSTLTMVLLAGCVQTSNQSPPSMQPVVAAPLSTDLPTGLTKGFSPPRPANPVNLTFSAQFPEWRHLVAKGSQIVVPPGKPEGWYDALVGPLTPGEGPIEITGGGDDPRLNLRSSGVMLLRGRWITPTTRRTRGISGGGTFFNAPLTGCENTQLTYAGTLIVYSGVDKDIILFPKMEGDSADKDITHLLRHWDPNCSSPDSGPNCERPECHTMVQDHYYVLTSNPATQKVEVKKVAWSLPLNSGQSHDARAVQIINELNRAMSTAAIPAVNKPIPPLRMH
jgi:hypothetical protein